MTAINHALTGAVIGLMIGNPVIALPAALLSHFVCDALPHFGSNDKTFLESKTFRRILITDAALCVLLVAGLALTQPHHWWLAAIAAFVATSPDFAWLPGYIRVKRGKPFTGERPNVFMRFAAAIQWFERPSGAILELLWFITGVIFVAAHL